MEVGRPARLAHAVEDPHHVVLAGDDVLGRQVTQPGGDRSRGDERVGVVLGLRSQESKHGRRLMYTQFEGRQKTPGLGYNSTPATVAPKVRAVATRLEPSPSRGCRKIVSSQVRHVIPASVSTGSSPGPVASDLSRALSGRDAGRGMRNGRRPDHARRHRTRLRPLSSTTTSKFGAKVNELQIVDQKPGTGAEAVSGKAVDCALHRMALRPGHGRRSRREIRQLARPQRPVRLLSRRRQGHQGLGRRHRRA